MSPPRVVMLPAYQASRSIAPLVTALLTGFDEVWVVDDGSTDGTAEVARAAGALVVSHAQNRGKGAAIRTALAIAERRGIDAVVTVDADGQHLPEDAIRLDRGVEDRRAIVLGVRDMARDGAPTTNQRGNRIANYWVELFTEISFLDSQCGLRRYPVKEVLALGVTGERFLFESEVLIRAIPRGVRVVEFPVDVRYPPERTSHFRLWVDPTRITFGLIATGAKIGTLVPTLQRLTLREAYDVHFDGPLRPIEEHVRAEAKARAARDEAAKKKGKKGG